MILNTLKAMTQFHIFFQYAFTLIKTETSNNKRKWEPDSAEGPEWMLKRMINRLKVSYEKEKRQ